MKALEACTQIKIKIRERVTIYIEAGCKLLRKICMTPDKYSKEQLSKYGLDVGRDQAHCWMGK